MPETAVSLDEFLCKKIAEDLGILPEQVTTEFIHEMRKRMYQDPQFQFDRSSEFLPDLDISFPTLAEREEWKRKCRKWAQEVLQQGRTAC